MTAEPQAAPLPAVSARAIQLAPHWQHPPHTSQKGYSEECSPPSLLCCAPKRNSLKLVGKKKKKVFFSSPFVLKQQKFLWEHIYEKAWKQRLWKCHAMHRNSSFSLGEEKLPSLATPHSNPFITSRRAGAGLQTVLPWEEAKWSCSAVAAKRHYKCDRKYTIEKGVLNPR